MVTTSNLDKGMNWINNMLKLTSENTGLHIETWHWEQTANPNERAFYLTIQGRDKQKAIKEFSMWELENCPHDVQVQDILQMRIVKLLTFVAFPQR